jgi:excisionase family DNA binding protein
MAERWPGLLNTVQAAEYLGVSADTVQRERAAGRIKSVLLRGMVKYSREALDEFIRDLPEGSGTCVANEVRERKRKEDKSKRQSRRVHAESLRDGQPAA